MPDPLAPFVRVVVLNWNSAWFTRRCLHALAQTEYPADRYEVVVVDNASIDGSLEQIRHSFPHLRVIANELNLGFAEGNNRAMRDLEGVDAVALVNNDAVVEPGWLRPLVAGLQGDPTVGAVAARLVLEPAFTTMGLRVAGGTAMLDSVRVDGLEVLDRARMDGIRSVGRVDWPMELVHHVDGDAVLRLPVGSGPRRIEVSARGSGRLVASTTADRSEGVLAATTAVMSLSAGEDRIELLNGLGTELGADCEGIDRHFGEPVDVVDGAAPEVVSGFCGGGVLLRSRMLEEVGVFDPAFFAYYEDTDLSWRARNAGWATVTAPASVIRHSFGGSAGAKARGFFFLNYRNWMMTVLRNADRPQRRRAASSAWARLRWAIRANVLSPLKHRRRPDTALVRAWATVLVGTLLAARDVQRTRRSGRVGSTPTDRVRSRLQPPPMARPPASRPGGPRIVYLDLTVPDPASVALLGSLVDAEPRIDLVPVVRDAASPTGLRRAGPSEVGSWLGVDGPHTPADVALLTLTELATGSVVVRRHDNELAVVDAGSSTRLTEALPFPLAEGLPDGSRGWNGAALERLADELLMRLGTP